MKQPSIKLVMAFILLCTNAIAQPWQKTPIVAEQKNNFYGIQKQFHEFWDSKKPSEHEEENIEEGGYQQFARWENFMKTRAYPSGKIPDPDILVREYERTKSQRSASSSIMSASWTFMGPNVVPAGGGGAGRVNCVAFHPTNANIMYVGGACGGVWKTTDGGLTWSTTTDQLAAIAIADIAIDPLNPDNIYAATGDGYGYEVWGNIFWGGTYTAGVMKSVDGGITWSQSGLSFNQTQSDIIQRIIINPVNPSILLACTRNAIYRTIDSGANWTQVTSGHFYDLEFNALNPNTVYAVDNNLMYRSLDGGATFNPYSNNLGSSGRISLAVTPADTTIVYALTQDATFYRSSNGGQLFNQGSVAATLYGYYDCVLAVSPVNPQRVIVAGFNMVMSDDGGLTWNSIANNGGNDYVHVDNHTMAFLPGSNSTIFSGNDGGFFRTDNSGTDWTDLSNGINIKQYYRMSSSLIDPDLLYAGAQDNGTDQLKNNMWTQVYGADGMDCLTDYNDVNTAYVSYQNGAFFRSTDGGISFANISPGGGSWTTPIVQDPSNPGTIYIGTFELQKSIDQGSTWNSISPGVFNSDIEHIAIAPSNNNYIYACTLDMIQMTANGGTNWINITAGLPVANAPLTGIAISSSDPLHVWVTLAGYVGGSKVYKSIDGGITWTNVSGTLPNIPADCIVYQDNTIDELYLGTDFGVYYMNDTMSDWVPYQSGLPNVIIDDIEINYTASKVRVATYGRGIWESDLITSTLFITDAGVKSILSPTGTYCQPSINPVIEIKNYGMDTLYTADIKYQLDNGPLQTQSWNGTLAPAQSTTVALGTMSPSSGMHTFTAFTDNPNGTTDGNPINNQKISSFQIDNISIPYPVTEGFEIGGFPFPDWHLQGASALMAIAPVGGFGNSTHSMRADYYSIASATAYFVSKQIDLSNAASFARLDFNVAYAEYSPQYQDTLNVSISTDCGTTWTSVYSKTGPVLATAPATTSIFVPASSEWRAESINLNSWIGQQHVIARFEMLSGFGNELYIDDINLYAGTVGVPGLPGSDIVIAPVPFNNTLNIESTGEDIYSYTLTDITGKLIAEESNIGKKSIVLLTENISSGMYLLRIATAEGAVVKKVMRQ